MLVIIYDFKKMSLIKSAAYLSAKETCRTWNTR